MNSKGTGAVFCLISALLMSTRYLSAAIFLSGAASWDAELFRAGLEYVGSPLKIASMIALAAGVCFLLAGIVQDIRKTGK